MSYLGGQHVVNCLQAHYSDRMVEVVSLTCQTCGQSSKLYLPHSTSDRKIVSAFRKEGWKCGNDGKRAKCPNCVKK